MAVLGPTEPAWVTTIRERGPELGLEVRQHLPHMVGSCEVEVADGRLLVRAEPRNDRYLVAWHVSQQVGPLWPELLGPAGVDAFLSIGSLHMIVPAETMVAVAEGGDRRRWAAGAQTTIAPGG